MDAIRRRLQWVYLAEREKSLSPKTQKNDNGNAIRKKINKHKCRHKAKSHLSEIALDGSNPTSLRNASTSSGLASPFSSSPEQ